MLGERALSPSVALVQDATGRSVLVWKWDNCLWTYRTKVFYKDYEDSLYRV